MATNALHGYQISHSFLWFAKGYIGGLNLDMIRLKSEQIECEQEANEPIISSQQISQRKNRNIVHVKAT